ncbi:MAG: metallophosphoesterase [Anaerolineae bacterium]
MQHGYNLLVVSDLHLGEGWDPETARTSRLEDFFRDDAFARFLRYHEGIRDQPRFGGRPWLLILNGDIFDFLQVISLPKEGPPLQRVKGVTHLDELCADERAHGLGTTPKESAWKLTQIARGHQRFFAALGSFLAHDNQVAVVRGNHDVDLHWERVRACFVEETFQAYERQRQQEGVGPQITLYGCRDRIRFYPWFYHELERVYVEHGGQYDVTNHFSDFQNPVSPNDPGRIDLPWGSLFVRYLFNKVEDVHPFADNVKPLTRYLSWAFRTDPIRALEILFERSGVFLRAFWIAARKAASALRPRVQSAPSCDEMESLPAQVTRQIDSLARRQVGTAWQTWVATVIRALISLLTLLIMGVFIALAATTLALQRGPQTVALFHLAMAALTGLLGRGLQRALSRLLERHDLLEAAGELEQILRSAGGVQYVVMGHNHQPAVEPLNGAWYVNTGAWVPVYQKEGPVEGREALTFFRLAWGYRGTPELLRWDDAAGAPTKMIL